MARSYQQMIILGNLGKDPEVRYTASGAAVATLTVATTDSRKDKNSGEWIEETEWHRVVLWRRLAEIAGEYLRSGRQVFIIGKKKTRKWQDKQGHDQYTTEIVADVMQIIGARETDREVPPGDSPVYHSQEGAQPTGTGSNFDDYDDDIQF